MLTGSDLRKKLEEVVSLREKARGVLDALCEDLKSENLLKHQSVDAAFSCVNSALAEQDKLLEIQEISSEDDFKKVSDIGAAIEKWEKEHDFSEKLESLRGFISKACLIQNGDGELIEFCSKAEEALGRLNSIDKNDYDAVTAFIEECSIFEQVVGIITGSLSMPEDRQEKKALINALASDYVDLAERELSIREQDKAAGEITAVNKPEAGHDDKVELKAETKAENETGAKTDNDAGNIKAESGINSVAENVNEPVKAAEEAAEEKAPYEEDYIIHDVEIEVESSAYNVKGVKKIIGDIFRPSTKAYDKHFPLLFIEFDLFHSCSIELFKTYVEHAGYDVSIVDPAIEFLLRKGFCQLLKHKEYGNILAPTPKLLVVMEKIRKEKKSSSNKTTTIKHTLNNDSLKKFKEKRVVIPYIVDHHMSAVHQYWPYDDLSYSIFVNEKAYCLGASKNEQESPFAISLGGCGLIGEKDGLNIGLDNLKLCIISERKKDNAFILAKALLEKYPQLKEARAVIYALEANEYYDYETMAELKGSDVWDPAIFEKEELENDKEADNLKAEEVETTLSEDGEHIEETNSVKTEELEPVIEPEDAENEPETVPESENEETPEPITIEKSAIFAPEDMDIEEDSKASVNENMDDILKDVCDMVNNGRNYCATAYLKAANGAEAMYEQFAYALNDPMANCSYLSKVVLSHYPEQLPVTNYLKTAALIRAFFSKETDYDLKGMKEVFAPETDEFAEEGCPSIKDIMFKLYDFKLRHRMGMDGVADYRKKNDINRNEAKKRLQIDVGAFCDSLEQSIKNENTVCARFVECLKLVYSADTDLVKYMKGVAEGKDDDGFITAVTDFLGKEFMRDGCDISVENIDRNKMTEYVDLFWELSNDKVRLKSRERLLPKRYTSVATKLKRMIEYLCKWIDLNPANSNVKNSDAELEYEQSKGKLMEDLKLAVDFLSREGQEPIKEAGSRILLSALEYVRSCIDGSFDSEANKYFYMDFLRGDLITLDSDYMPVINHQYDDVAELSFKHRVIAHSTAELPSLEERVDCIFNGDEDYGSARLIMNYLSSHGKDTKYADDLADNAADAAKEADVNYTRCIDDLDYMEFKGQIDNLSVNNKDYVQSNIQKAYLTAKTTNNFSFFYKVCNAYKKKLMGFAKNIGARTEYELNELIEKYNNDPEKNPEMKQRLMNIQDALEKQEYTIAEDRLSRYRNNESDVFTELFETDYLEMFMNQYDMCFNTVSSRRSGQIFNKPPKMANRDEKISTRLMDNWVNSRVSRDSIKNLLEAMEFVVTDISVEKGVIKNASLYLVHLNYNINNSRHPVTAFGFEAQEKGIRVLVLQGNYEANNLLEKQRELGSEYNTLVLLDGYMSSTERRKLARKIKKESPSKAFAVIDRVVMQFLISNCSKDRMNQMVLSIIMPFSYYQPYVWESSKNMPPDIFMGRKKELTDIVSPQGVNLVYGGRQLGKSALLRMAKQSVDSNELGNRAVYVDIKNMNVDEAACAIGRKLYMEGIIREKKASYTWQELTYCIEERLTEEEDRIPYFLLLIDEGDKFIEDCASVAYKPFDYLKQLQGIGIDRFKFVIAGLHNIIRFKREALGNNSVITQLRALTVKPFASPEARELLKAPLYYMGLRFPSEYDKLCTLILARANYFPGLIQLYCAKLLEAMTKDDYAGYRENDTPPYVVMENHIKKILADEEFKQQVQEKFEITLELDDDDYYKVIALLLARLYNTDESRQGFSANDIFHEGEDCMIGKISKLSVEKMTALLDELVELNILKEINGNYSFNRHHFLTMMGDDASIERKLVEYIGD